MSARRIVYVSGTRADFGLMKSTLKQADADPRLDVQLCVTGMHLLTEFGMTVNDIEASGLNIAARIPIDLANADGARMAIGIADTLTGLTQAFRRLLPDLIVLLGDRGEMLAGAIAALHLNIPIAHIHGGELSGTVDEPVRHAISKLSHYHFVATPGARERLIRMGERDDHIFVTGAPGLDGLTKQAGQSCTELRTELKLNPVQPIALVVFHPVVQSADQAGAQALSLATTLLDTELQLLWLRPNADAGGGAIRDALEQHEANPALRLITHWPRDRYLSWLACADVMIGNSSSGIIEAASLNLPVVNIGDRQQGRERSTNVVDCDLVSSAIPDAVAKALAMRGTRFDNVYGDGRAGARITELLATLPLGADLLNKLNTY